MQTIVGTFDELEDDVPGCIYPHPMVYNIRTSFVGFITRYHYHKQQHCVYVEVSFLTTFFSINHDPTISTVNCVDKPRSE